MRRGIAPLALTLLFALWPCTDASAADWHVNAAAAEGDGTKEKPFADIQQAVDKAVGGDVIHVVQGEYHGKLKCGFIVIDKSGLTIVGGYKDAAFAERNPFVYLTTVKESPDFKGSKFAGGYFQMEAGGRPTVHRSTTIDGFWFDRKGQNSYSKEGNLGVTVSNTKPVLWFESPDCHVRNCVFLNTALYALRMKGDGSSAENNVFVNTNYCGIDVVGVGEKLEKGYPFPKFKIAHNTFFSIWNADSLEEGAGNAICHAGNATVEIADNIFHLSTGVKSSMGWCVKDLRNMKADRWITFNRNSISQMRGGIYIYYDTKQTASIGVWEKPEQLKETVMAEAVENNFENPFYELDKEWFERYVAVVPHEDVSNKKVNMDDYNKMARLFGKPLQDVPRKPGHNMGAYYPLEHVKTGALFKPTNDAVKARGVQAAGPFPVTKAPHVGAAEPASTAGREYEEMDFDTLVAKGEQLIDKGVKVKCYYEKLDQGFTAGAGKEAKPYLEGADKSSHRILVLRKVPEIDKGLPTLRGFLKNASAASNYFDANAKRAGGRGNCDFSFVMTGVVRKSGVKISGKGPQIVIEIDGLTDK